MDTRDENKSKAPGHVKSINDTHVQNETNGNRPDPGAKRNIGLHGETERRGQKDKLENMHIAGNETTGYGANNPDSKDYLNQGPGFEAEGSDQDADGSPDGVRTQDQPFRGQAGRQAEEDKS
ncbi:MAG: hypothetical protein ACO1NZ_11015 [Adhaeribacter sp.]